MFAKKTLVAAAALLALVGAAQAQVKVYGAVDMSFGSFELAHAKGTSTRVTAVQSGQMMTSFLGFSGSEDLGGGLKAEFALETFMAADTGQYLANNANAGSAGFWGRASNIALSGGFGKVALGQYDNPLFTAGYTYDPFGSSMTFSPTMRHYSYIGQTSVASVGRTPISGAGVGFDTGWVNSITYETPNMSGFTGVVQYSPKESATAGTQNSYTVSGSYNAGPLSLMAVYVKGGVTTQPSATAYTADEKVWSLGASYDFGVLKGFASYAQVKDTTFTNKDKIYQIGASIPVTDKGAVLLSYGELKNTVTGAATSAKDRVLSVGYDYNLSKRTDVYAVFSNNAQTNTANNESGQTFAFGVKHNF